MYIDIIDINIMLKDLSLKVKGDPVKESFATVYIDIIDINIMPKDLTLKVLVFVSSGRSSG